MRPLAQARQLHSQGVIENNAGHPVRATRLFRRALALLDADHLHSSPERQALTARVWISLAMSQSELAGLDAGLAALAEAERYVNETGAPDVAVHLHLQLGYMRVRGGHLAEGLVELDRAEALIRYADPAAASNIVLNRGSLHLYRGDLRSARHDLARAAALATAHGLAVEECKARHNLGYLEFLAGNLATALQRMDAAAALDAEVSRAVILLDRSRVLIEAGLHRDADDALIEAAQLFATDRLWKDVGEVELARAECALLDGEVAAARRLAGRARDRFRRRRNDRWRRSAELVLLQADLQAGRPGSRLAPPALRLASELRAEGLQVQAQTAQLIAAEALLRSRRLEQARAAAAEAGVSTRVDPIALQLHRRLVHAQLAVAGADVRRSRHEIRMGLAELAKYQAKFGSIDMRTAGAIHGRQLAELSLQLALSDGRPATVLAAVEQGRAISNRLPSVSAPTDPVASDLLAELRQIVEGLRTIESDPAEIAEADSQRRRVAEIQRELRSRSWQAEGVGRAEKPATLAEVGAGLSDASSVLVTYLDVAGQLHAVVVGDRAPRIVALSPQATVSEQARRIRADLDVIASGQLPNALHAAVTGSLKRSLSVIESALLRPLGLPDQRVVIVPTGVLGTLPWTNLPLLQGRPVVVAPSATAWLAASGPVNRSHPTVSAFAGPDLLRSADEVKAVGDLWPRSSVFTDARAHREELAAALSAATVVHVAAHGEHQADNPLFSSIRLADAPLFAYELDQHARASEHVILSACELGRATVRPGDEALGLTSVLLRLGSRSVISGVARVHDDVAAEVMTRYHRLLSAGVDSAQALTEACAGSDLPAPFVCFGSTW